RSAAQPTGGCAGHRRRDPRPGARRLFLGIRARGGSARGAHAPAGRALGAAAEGNEAARAPTLRWPFGRKVVGGPLTRRRLPSAWFLSSGVAQVFAGGSTPFSIVSSQAWLGFFEHQILREISAESGAITG